MQSLLVYSLQLPGNGCNGEGLGRNPNITRSRTHLNDQKMDKRLHFYYGSEKLDPAARLVLAINVFEPSLNPIHPFAAGLPRRPGAP